MNFTISELTLILSALKSKTINKQNELLMTNLKAKLTSELDRMIANIEL